MKRFLAFTLTTALATVSAVAGPFADYDQGIVSNDSRIVGWATGWQNFVQPDPSSGGFAHDNNNQSDTIDASILGPPIDFSLNGTTKHVLSLGHGASIVLTFGGAIPRQGHWNFAIFNNAFLSTAPGLAARGGGTNYVYNGHGTNLAPVVRGYNFIWSKPAFVDVSSDATNWARFPVTYWNTDILFQATVPDAPGHWLSQDATMMDGLAGKSALQYGTPFSLSALTNSPLVVTGAVDLNKIRYVRLTDMVGDGSTTDQFGNAIYAPYYDGAQLPALAPTPDSTTDGFCLRGAAILETPVPTVGGITVTPSGLFIGLGGLYSGQTYMVQSATNLTSALWSNETTFVAFDNSLSLTNNVGSARQKFYRIGPLP